MKSSQLGKMNKYIPFMYKIYRAEAKLLKKSFSTLEIMIFVIM